MIGASFVFVSAYGKGLFALVCLCFVKRLPVNLRELRKSLLLTFGIKNRARLSQKLLYKVYISGYESVNQSVRLY